MFCWHKWNKWGDVKKENWKQTNIIYQTSENIIRSYQDRTCKKCCKYQKRYVKEN